MHHLWDAFGWLRSSRLKRVTSYLLVIGGLLTAANSVLDKGEKLTDRVSGLFGDDSPKKSAVSTADNPRAFATQFIRLFFAEPAEYWQLLNPEEKKLVSKEKYVECLPTPVGLV